VSNKFKKGAYHTFCMWIFRRIEFTYFLKESVITGQGMKINASCQGGVKKKFSIFKRISVEPVDIAFTRN
jgi:hypothetical protein